MAKKSKVSRFSRFSKQQIIIALVFIIGFGGFGVWKLAFSSAATYASNCSSRYLKLNDRGSCVKYLQEALNGSGSQPQLVLNGKFDNSTRQSVIFYKQNNGWGYADGYGVAGPDFAGRMCAGATLINYCVK